MRALNYFLIACTLAACKGNERQLEAKFASTESLKKIEHDLKSCLGFESSIANNQAQIATLQGYATDLNHQINLMREERLGTEEKIESLKAKMEELQQKISSNGKRISDLKATQRREETVRQRASTLGFEIGTVNQVGGDLYLSVVSERGYKFYRKGDVVKNGWTLSDVNSTSAVFTHETGNVLEKNL